MPLVSLHFFFVMTFKSQIPRLKEVLLYLYYCYILHSLLYIICWVDIVLSLWCFLLKAVFFLFLFCPLFGCWILMINNTLCSVIKFDFLLLENTELLQHLTRIEKARYKMDKNEQTEH